MAEGVISLEKRSCIFQGMSNPKEEFWFVVLEQENINLSPEQECKFKTIIANEIINQLRAIPISDKDTWLEIKRRILSTISGVNLEKEKLESMSITLKVIEKLINVNPEPIFVEIEDLLPTKYNDFVIDTLLGVLTLEQLDRLYLRYQFGYEPLEEKL